LRNNDVNRLFEALTPGNEQKETMLHNILMQSQQPNKRNHIPVKRLRLAVLAVTLMICLTTTAFAAAYMGLDEAFMRFLKPANHEQVEYLSNGAHVVDQQVKNEKGTLHIKQVIGDRNLTYILMDFTAPEGTVLDAARYRFEYPSISTNQSYHSVGVSALDDENPKDNKLSLIMTIMTENSIAGQTAHFKFNDLQAADPFPAIFETVIPGTWETTFKLDFKEYAKLYQVDQNITMFGYDVTIKSISVSPISVALKIESEFLQEINEEASGKWVEIGENEYLDQYPITITYKDGSSETTSIFNGLHLVEPGYQMLTIKTFEKVINDKEIASIVFFDKVIPIDQLHNTASCCN